MTDRLTGVIAPILTPFAADGRIAQDAYAEHARGVLAAGAHYLSPFGTTGEANSISMRERMEAIEHLVASGAAEPGQLMPGTGLCALDETETLCRHAVELGCVAVLVLPPFFYRNATDDGLYRYYAALVERLAATAGSRTPGICLYHIPQNTGLGISPGLAARLAAAFPSEVVALKDSSGDWQNTQAIIRAVPELAVFPGSESLMLPAMRLGGAGCISASVNSNAAAIRALYDLCAVGDWDAAEAALPPVEAHRQALQQAGLIPALKALKAQQSSDPGWLRLRPPLLDAEADQGLAVAATLPGASG